MKRCPQCNRVERDITLAFCRVDGTPLVTDERKTIDSSMRPSHNIRVAGGDIETRILPQLDFPSTDRAAAPTTVHIKRPSRRFVTTTFTKALLLSAAVAVLVALALFTHLHLTGKTPAAINSVAVLPFQNESGDRDSEYLSDGLSEALINSLTELHQLRVIARTTAFHYKDKDIDPRELGRELNVQSILTGRVRQQGDNLSVQVDLIDATTGAQLWGREYERKVADALSIKQAIAHEVKEKLRVQSSVAEQQRLEKSDATNAEAYQSYLRGRYFWNQRGADKLTKALAEFQNAIERDPNFALGYVGLADCYVIQEESAGVPASESLPKARAAADRALQLDDSSAEAHTSSAMVYQHLWRWQEAESEYQKAITLNPNYATAHQWYSNYLFASGHNDEALREGKRALELDPLSPIINHNVAFIYLLKNDVASAVAAANKGLELSANFPALLNDLGWAHLKQKRFAEAIVEFQKAVEASTRGGSSLGNLGYCYAVSGNRGEAVAIAKELEERYKSGKAVAVFLAGVYAGLGDTNKAFDLLERDYQQHSGQIPAISFWMSLEVLRSDPRYLDLMRRIWQKP